MATDPRTQSIEQHKRWLGYLQPVGLVVSAPALVDADCHVNLDVADEHRRFVGSLAERFLDGSKDAVSVVPSIRSLLQEVCGWRDSDFVGRDDPRAEKLAAPVQVYGEVLRPTYGVPADSREPEPKWLMLIEEMPPSADLDAAPKDGDQLWKAAPQARFERLLRETEVPVGLLANGTHLRLVYAPRGESVGHVTFPVAEMLKTSGRLVFAAFVMLLRDFRVFNAPSGQGLVDILAASRKYQNTVSNELARQVLAALYELLRGFQSANARARGELLRDLLAASPDEVYAGQLTVLLRLVFLLYAEDRGLMPGGEVYVRNYSVTGLFEKLRGDEGRHPDTMDQRFGAWARLLALFRMVHDGAKSKAFQLPPRHGYLFEPDRYPFLEGRPPKDKRQPRQRITPPLVSDGVVLRVLRNLLILDGERLSYRALDVEQIGSVYEAMMGFRVETAAGRSIAVRPKKPHGAPVSINLDALFAVPAGDRAKKFKEWTELAPTPTESAALKAATSVEEIHAAILKKVERDLTPQIVPAGSMVLQPSDERRRSGSHYTPRSLTGTIVAKALEPVLQQMGERPTPAHILALKICDPAMGSGAFLVEACRQLGEKLVESWAAHRATPIVPPDEDELLHAQRLVAQRCLYGVDKNPMAVDLAKLSLWLTTLAKDHPFTFVDHALREGDSLVGLTREEIEGFFWPGLKPKFSWRNQLRPQIENALRIRREILEAGDEVAYGYKESQLASCRNQIDIAREVGDMIIACFFAESKDKARKSRLERVATEYSDAIQKNDPLTMLRLRKEGREVLEQPPRLRPFHWEIEFPEVFERESGGFDSMVGNPPFLGGTLIGGRHGTRYHEYLISTYQSTTGLSDIVAYFFRTSFNLLRTKGSLGLIATNTVAQGDTRESGLAAIASTGGTIYSANRRHVWAGQAAVTTCHIHIFRGAYNHVPVLDGESVDRISAFLMTGTADGSPAALSENSRIAFRGTKVWGAGFVFEHSPNGGSSSIDDMQLLIKQNPHNKNVIFKYIGGEEFNSSPTLSASRFVIDFGSMSKEEANKWPDLMAILKDRVYPVRVHNKQKNYRDNWWLHANRVEESLPFLDSNGRLLAITSVSKHMAPAFVEKGTIAADSMTLILLSDYGSFAIVQSRVHEVWARFTGSTFEDRLRYTTSCFDTFPRPRGPMSLVDAVGEQYFDFRRTMMIQENMGLTDCYNLFHDPDERSPDILKLRELHAAMDRAVLDAYGGELAKLVVPPCEFLLDYEDEDEEEESAGRRQRKKPWRYRWPDAFRDEVLALLLELNKERAAAEAPAKKASGRKKAAKKEPSDGDLFTDAGE